MPKAEDLASLLGCRHDPFLPVSENLPMQTDAHHEQTKRIFFHHVNKMHVLCTNDIL